MIDINDYIKLTRCYRRKHLNLQIPCLERGGMSTHHKGVLAQFLNTSIPKGKILLCHACNNEKCSNPKHLYWGTFSDNMIDYKQSINYKSIYQNTVNKYGIKATKKMLSNNGKTSRGGLGNKGKPKSKEHRKKLSEATKKYYASSSKCSPTAEATSLNLV